MFAGPRGDRRWPSNRAVGAVLHSFSGVAASGGTARLVPVGHSNTRIGWTASRHDDAETFMSGADFERAQAEFATGRAHASARVECRR